MDNELTQRNLTIKKGTMAAFLFAFIAMVGAQVISSLFKLPTQLGLSIGLIIGTIVLLCGPCAPEKGTLLADHNRMDGTAFVVMLGAFIAAKLISLLAGAGLALVLFNGADEENLLSMGASGDRAIWLMISMGIVTPFCEEAAFRGCVGNTFKKYGIWFGMIMSSLLFAVYHCNAIQLVTTFLPGIVLFYVAMNYSLKWSILFHFINNALLGEIPAALKKIAPDSFLVNYGEYFVEAALIIAALCLMKKDNAKEKVKAFLSGPGNEKGVYKAAMKNIWFVLIVIAMLLVTALMISMAHGSIDVAGMAAAYGA